MADEIVETLTLQSNVADVAYDAAEAIKAMGAALRKGVSDASANAKAVAEAMGANSKQAKAAKEAIKDATGYLKQYTSEQRNAERAAEKSAAARTAMAKAQADQHAKQAAAARAEQSANLKHYDALASAVARERAAADAVASAKAAAQARSIADEQRANLKHNDAVASAQAKATASEKEKAKAARKPTDGLGQDEERKGFGLAVNRLPPSLMAKEATSGIGPMVQKLVKGGIGQLSAGGFDISSIGGLITDLEKVGSIFKALGPVAGAVAKGVAVLGAAALAAAGAVIAFGIKASSFAIDQASFKEKSVRQLGAASGGKGGGEASFKMALKLAADLNIDKHEAVEKVKQLLQAGLSQQQVKLTMTAVADLREVKGDEAANQLAKGIEKIKLKGKFGQEAVDSLAEAGVSADAVYKELAKSTGQSLDIVKGKVKAGTIDVDKGIDAILKSIENKFGGAAAKAAKSIEGLTNRIKIAFASLFMNVNLQPIKDFLEGIAKSIEGPAGARLGKAFTDLFGNLFEALVGTFRNAKGKIDPGALVQAITGKVEALAAFIKENGDTIRTSIRMMGVAIEFMAFSLRLLEAVFTPVNAAIDAFWLAVEKLKSVFQTVGEGFANLYALITGQAPGIGNALTAGIADGITGGASGIITAMVNAVMAGVQAAEAAAQIGSPSALMRDMIGAPLAQGVAVGMDEGGAQVERSGAGLADTAVAGASGGGGGGKGGGAGGGGSVTINLHLPKGSPEATQAAAKKGTEEGLAAWQSYSRRSARDTAEAT